MHWHHAFVCIRTSHDIRCECMVWVDHSVDFGKSAPCLVSINCRGDMEDRHWLVSMVGSVAWDITQTERMILKKSKNVQC